MDAPAIPTARLVMSRPVNSEAQQMTAQSCLDAKALERLAPGIELALQRYVTDRAPGAGRKSPFSPAVLRRVLTGLCTEECGPEDQRRYLLFVAPIARRVVLSHVSGDAGRAATVRLQQLEPWLARLETFDSACALMIDLHYFAGLSLRETAAVLGVSRQTVVCDLRFARAWLQAYTGRSAMRGS